MPLTTLVPPAPTTLAPAPPRSPRPRPRPPSRRPARRRGRHRAVREQPTRGRPHTDDLGPVRPVPRHRRGPERSAGGAPVSGSAGRRPGRRGWSRDVHGAIVRVMGCRARLVGTAWSRPSRRPAARRRDRPTRAPRGPVEPLPARQRHQPAQPRRWPARSRSHPATVDLLVAMAAASTSPAAPSTRRCSARSSSSATARRGIGERRSERRSAAGRPHGLDRRHRGRPRPRHVALPPACISIPGAIGKGLAADIVAAGCSSNGARPAVHVTVGGDVRATATRGRRRRPAPVAPSIIIASPRAAASPRRASGAAGSIRRVGRSTTCSIPARTSAATDGDRDDVVQVSVAADTADSRRGARHRDAGRRDGPTGWFDRLDAAVRRRGGAAARRHARRQHAWRGLRARSAATDGPRDVRTGLVVPGAGGRVVTLVLLVGALVLGILLSAPAPSSRTTGRPGCSPCTAG